MAKARMIRHETQRRGFEEAGVNTGRIRARGTLAFATLYTDKDGCLTRDEQDFYGPKRRFYIERQLPSGAWITASREFQPATIEGCRNYVKGHPGYRVSALIRPGVWEVDSAPTPKAKVFYSQRERLAAQGG